MIRRSRILVREPDQKREDCRQRGEEHRDAKRAAHTLDTQASRVQLPCPSTRLDARRIAQILEHLGYYEKPTMPWAKLSPIKARQRAEALRPHLIELQVEQDHTDRETAAM